MSLNELKIRAPNLVLPLLVLGVVGVAPRAQAQSAGTFTSTGNMTTPRFGHSATLLNDGRVLIAGGSDGIGALTSAELYDPATGTFTATGSMTRRHDGPTAVLLPDGKVLITSGSPWDLYDPASGTFSPVEVTGGCSLLNRGVQLKDGWLLLFGPETIASLYDPSTGVCVVTGNTNSPFVDTATLLGNGEVLIYRGGPEQRPLCYAEVYHPATGTFTCTGDSIANHSGPTATLLTNGKVLLAGGDVGDGDGPSNVAELYDPATGIFSATGNMTTGREQNPATRLSDGSVLLTGGSFAPPVEATTELYNPGTGAFRTASNMGAGRQFHTVTLLKDGRVLVTGGAQDPWPTVLSSAEIYTPLVVVPAAALLSLSGDGKGQGAIQHSDTFQVVSADNPAIVGEILVIYCTGLIDGDVIPPQVAIGGSLAEVLWFGNTPGYAGLDQINVRVPSGSALGSAVPVRLNYLGRPSNEVTIGVR